MVKVQKPIPKTLSKSGRADKVSKKKNVEKIKKSAVDNVLTAKTASLAVPLGKNKDKTNREKTQTKAEEVKAQKKQKQQVDLPKILDTRVKQEKKEKKESTKPKKEKKVAATEVATKRPLVLAPPESPAPAPKPTPALNTKTKKAKLVIAQAAPKVKKSKQKAKKAKTTAAAVTQQPEAIKKEKQKQAQPLLTTSQKKKTAKRAFKKAQSKRANKDKVKPARAHLFEPVDFDEEKFDAILNVENIAKVAEALKTQVEAQVKEKKQTIFSDYRYMLNISYFKIPSCPKRMVKLNLKHSLVNLQDDDVVIVVADLQRGAKVDYEPTIQHYEDLFREAGVEGLKIMPYNQLRKECNTFEAVRKFGNTYDYFLCDGRVVGSVVGFCGKIFQKPRTTFHSVHMDKANIKAEIERALQRTAYKQLQKGDLISIPVGNHMQSAQEVADNIDCVISQLKNSLPGGMGNVRGIYLKLDIVGTTALPLYISMGQGPPEVPYVVGQREQRMLKVRKEANEVLAKFTLTKDADLQKLRRADAERKQRVMAARAALNRAEGEPMDDDGEDSAVPAKKARKEANVEKDVQKKSVEKAEQENDEDDVDDEDEDNDDDDDELDEEDNDENASDDDDDVDEDDDEEDENDVDNDDDGDEDDEGDGNDDDDDDDDDEEDDDDDDDE